MNESEHTSLRQLERHLASHDGFFVGPEGVKAPSEVFETLAFPPEHFESLATYSRLLLSPDFYRTFQRWNYLLIYQLDCLVFARSLTRWTSAGIDYVGAPFLGSQGGFSHVGNGGLSLRSIDRSARLLERGATGTEAWRCLRADLPDVRCLPRGAQLKKRLSILRSAIRGARDYASRYTLNEDRFWSDRCRLFDPSFRIASIDEALAFSFERQPRRCLEANGHQLPFGCHAFERYDPDFWHAVLEGRMADCA